MNISNSSLDLAYHCEVAPLTSQTLARAIFSPSVWLSSRSNFGVAPSPSGSTENNLSDQSLWFWNAVFVRRAKLACSSVCHALCCRMHTPTLRISTVWRKMNQTGSLGINLFLTKKITQLARTTEKKSAIAVKQINPHHHYVNCFNDDVSVWVAPAFVKSKGHCTITLTGSMTSSFASSLCGLLPNVYWGRFHGIQLSLLGQVYQCSSIVLDSLVRHHFYLQARAELQHNYRIRCAQISNTLALLTFRWKVSDQGCQLCWNQHHWQPVSSKASNLLSRIGKAAWLIFLVYDFHRTSIEPGGGYLCYW